MEAGNKITKTIYLFGKKIDVEIAVDNGEVVQLPPLTLRTRSGLELPAGAQCVATKRLEQSDISRPQSRLLIPRTRETYEFLNEREKEMVFKEQKGIEVKAMDNQYREHKLNLKNWESVEKLVLNKGWNGLVRMNNLDKGDVIDLWCYRQGEANELHFAVDICERHHHQPNLQHQQHLSITDLHMLC